jgi:hypothetical protein
MVIGTASRSTDNRLPFLSPQDWALGFRFGSSYTAVRIANLSHEVPQYVFFTLVYSFNPHGHRRATYAGKGSLLQHLGAGRA